MLGERGNKSRGVWGAAVAGVGCGALGTALYFVYSELTEPSPYNVLLLIYAPVFMTFGGMAGLLVWAMRGSGTDEWGPTPDTGRRGAARGREWESLPDKRRRPSFWRGPAVGASCGALGALLFWLYLELTGSPGAYGRAIALIYGSAFIAFCAVAGLVFGATRETD